MVIYWILWKRLQYFKIKASEDEIRLFADKYDKIFIKNSKFFSSIGIGIWRKK